MEKEKKNKLSLTKEEGTLNSVRSHAFSKNRSEVKITEGRGLAGQKSRRKVAGWADRAEGRWQPEGMGLARPEWSRKGACWAEIHQGEFLLGRN